LGLYHGLEGLNYNKKAGKCPAAVTARVLAVRGANRGDKGLSAMVELYWRCCPFTQAASIPEDLTDNELDEVLNAKTSFKKEL
jgi:hypothetical protein